MPNKLLYFTVYELIYTLFGNNNLIWKLQFRYVGLLVEVSIFSSIACYYCFYFFCFFSLMRFFSVNQGGSLSSAIKVLCGIKLAYSK